MDDGVADEAGWWVAWERGGGWRGTLGVLVGVVWGSGLMGAGVRVLDVWEAPRMGLWGSAWVGPGWVA